MPASGLDDLTFDGAKSCATMGKRCVVVGNVCVQCARCGKCLVCGVCVVLWCVALLCLLLMLVCTCVVLCVVRAVVCYSVAILRRFLEALWQTSAARVGSPLHTYSEA